MKYNEVINRLQKLIQYTPSQSQLCSITGVKQSTMSQRAKDNSSFKLEDIEKLNKFYNVNLFTVEISEINENSEKDKIKQALREMIFSGELDYNNQNSMKAKVSGFGHRLANLQQNLNLPDKDFSKILGLYQNEYIELKNGQREPNLNILIALKQHFNISVDSLLFG